MWNLSTLENNNWRPKKWDRLFSVLLCGLALLIGLKIPEHISVTMTPSLKYRVFFLRYGINVFHQGEYALFSISEIPLPASHTRKEKVAIKRVGCREGQVLQAKGLDFYCNGTFLGKAKTHDKQGTPSPPFSYDGPVPPDRYFVVGDSIDSYDSRYFGFIRKEDIHARAYPIF